MALTEQLTLEEFLRLPEQQPELEYERGVISQKMPPMARHSRLQVGLCIRFESHGYPEQVATAFSEVRVTWPGEGVSYVPDVSAYCVERVPVDLSGDVPDQLDVLPDIAVEISSPGQGLTRQMNRCRWYVAHGVPVALLVRPDCPPFWTFRPGTEIGPLQGEDVIDLGDVFEGLSFTVAELFGAMRPRSR
jgi:Uma2 family endonuclease